MTYYKCGSIHPTQNSNVVVDTASGAIANFQTPLAMPLLDAQIDVNAVQDLHGQSGAYPPGGGVNKFDKDTMVVSGYYIADTDGQAKPDSGSSCTDYIEINPDTSYYIKTEQTVGQWAAWYDENKDYISGFTMYNRVVTSPSTAKYIRLTILRGESGNINTFSVNYPSTDTAYHPYSNICPIVGWDEIKVVGCGKNLFDGVSVVYGYPFTGTIEGGNLMRVVFSRCKPNTTYTISKIQTQRFSVFWCEELPAVGVPYSGSTPDNLATSITVTTGATAKYICAFVYNQNVDTLTPEEILSSVQIEEGSQATTYEAYNSSTTVIQLNNTYYGGYFTQDKDGHRQFVVTREIIDLGEINWHYSVNDNWFQTAHAHKYPTSNNLCSCYPVVYSLVNLANKTIAVVTGYLAIKDTSFGSDENAFKTAMTGQKLVYELATPTIIDLPDDIPFKTIAGINNIFADTGDTSLQFRKIG